MFGKRKLKDEIVRLQYRVADLEERLCPCGQHDWIKTDKRLHYFCPYDDGVLIYRYKCKRCGREKEDII